MWKILLGGVPIALLAYALLAGTAAFNPQLIIMLGLGFVVLQLLLKGK